jgi:hypothetical protein
MRTAASRLGRVLRAARTAGSRSFAAEAAPAVSSDIGYVAQVNAGVPPHWQQRQRVLAIPSIQEGVIIVYMQALTLAASPVRRSSALLWTFASMASYPTS